MTGKAALKHSELRHLDDQGGGGRREVPGSSVRGKEEGKRKRKRRNPHNACRVV
jgi:hypothetical protein